MKFTAVGPKLIEINARCGGFYIVPWVRRVYGIDLVLCAYMCACGIEPAVERDAEARLTLVGCQLFPSQHREALQSFALPRRIKQLATPNSHLHG